MLVLNALGMATQRRENRDGLIVHSDRGTQGEFTSWAFSDRLRAAGIAPSMGAVGAAADKPAEIEAGWLKSQDERFLAQTAPNLLVDETSSPGLFTPSSQGHHHDHLQLLNNNDQAA